MTTQIIPFNTRATSDSSATNSYLEANSSSDAGYPASGGQQEPTQGWAYNPKYQDLP